MSAVSEWYANEKPSGPYQPPTVEELEPDISFTEATGAHELSALPNLSAANSSSARSP